MTGRVVLISGGSKGLGAAMARYFIAQADQVIVFDLETDPTSKDLSKNYHFYTVDICDDEALDTALAQVKARFSHIDVLINNACSYSDAGLASTREQWHRTLDVNLISAAVLTQKVVPLMPSGGVVINLGSVGGKVAGAGRLLYPASKAALLQITKNLAVELAPQGIRVISVSPAWTWSPALEAMVAGDRGRADTIGGQVHPLGRVADPEEIAAAVGFLASNQASWITGVDIPVDGGFTALGPDQGKGPRYWLTQETTLSVGK